MILRFIVTSSNSGSSINIIVVSMDYTVYAEINLR